jgi:quercetin dioxygenase-like cupin family protein
MTNSENQDSKAMEVALACDDIGAAIDYYTGRPGLRVDSIFPADSPRVAVLSGGGLVVRLESTVADASGAMPAQDTEPSLVVTKLDQGVFGSGRAGMEYRDLIPGRYGGRFIASHIRIPEGGPVPDYVHHHDVFFQMIFCVSGWVRVVYEDQGEPKLLEAGDCFLQPPHIRHRVLECSDAMEVVEIACPAEHETSVDHDMVLPTAGVRPERDFGGQRFVFDKASGASWLPHDVDGFEYRDTGIAAATDDAASAIVMRATKSLDVAGLRHNAELRFLFILHGQATLEGNGHWSLCAGDSCAIPPRLEVGLRDISGDFECLEVMIASQSTDR